MKINLTRKRFYAALVVLLCLFVKNILAAETTRVSIGSGGEQGNNHSYSSSLSANGRWLAFVSNASNLVSGDTNDVMDVFVYDRQTQETKRVSVDSAGNQGNDFSYFPSMSSDGRWVAFASLANNLVTNDTNTVQDIFVHDLLTHQTTRVSVDSSNGQASDFSNAPSISSDGRIVAFYSPASNLVLGDTNDYADVFVHDRLSRKTTRVSVSSTGIQGDCYSSYPGISANGRWVAFGSCAFDMVENDTNGTHDVFVHDRFNHETTRISVNSEGIESNGWSEFPSLSADGRWVVFESSANNLVAGDTNGNYDVFLHNRLTHETTRVSVDSMGVQGNQYSTHSTLSANGRWVAFVSMGDNLVAGDTNIKNDVFLYDRLMHQTTRISVKSNGLQANQGSDSPSLSAEGRWVSFASLAGNLVANDSNKANDVFVRDRTLVKRYQGDLQIETTQQPATLAQGSLGSYNYVITNNGPDTIYSVIVTHLISNGQVVSFTPSQGSCRRYTSISLCNLSQLDSGSSLTLTANVKAIRDAVSQQVSVSSAARADPQAANNIVAVETPVVPQ